MLRRGFEGVSKGLRRGFEGNVAFLPSCRLLGLGHDRRAALSSHLNARPRGFGLRLNLACALRSAGLTVRTVLICVHSLMDLADGLRVRQISTYEVF